MSKMCPLENLIEVKYDSSWKVSLLIINTDILNVKVVDIFLKRGLVFI